MALVTIPADAVTLRDRAEVTAFLATQSPNGAGGSSRYRVTLSDGTTVLVSRTRAPELRKYMR